MLEENDWIVVFIGSQQTVKRILRGTGVEEFSSRNMEIECFEILGMERSKSEPPTTGKAIDERGIRSRAEVIGAGI